MPDLRGDKDCRASWLVRRRNFNLGLFRILLAPEKAKTAFRYIFAFDDLLFDTTETHATFKPHPGANVLAPVFPALGRNSVFHNRLN